MRDPDDLFATGLYADMYAYKLSLRDAYLDPDVLYAATEYAVAVGNLLATGGPERAATIGPKVRAAQDAANGALRAANTLSKDDHFPRFERSRQGRRAAAAKSTSARPRWAHSTPTPWGKVLRIAAVMFVVWGAFSTVRSAGAAGAQPSRRLAKVEPWIPVGNIFETAGRGVFIGEGDPKMWSGWTPEARLAHAETLRSNLAVVYGVDSALVKIGEGTAVIIESGKVVFIQ
jgi:hypothetical protein